MYKPESIYTKIALQAIVSYLTEGITIEFSGEDVPPELLDRKACFVTIHLSDGSLRGCIGTLSPHTENLGQEIIQNSISAATRDTRFEAVTEEELDDIYLSVSVLSEPYKINDFDELDPKEKGVVVRLNGKTMAVLLPNIPGIDSVDDQIDKLKRKGGIEDIGNEYLEFYAFTTKENK